MRPAGFVFVVESSECTFVQGIWGGTARREGACYVVVKTHVKTGMTADRESGGVVVVRAAAGGGYLATPRVFTYFNH